MMSATSMAIPNGPALVFTQLIVCGCSLSDRRNLERMQMYCYKCKQ